MLNETLIDVIEVKPPPKPRGKIGQALVEYALIVVLVVVGLGAALAAVGPALGNVFSNQVYNLLGQTTTPYSTLNPATFWAYVTAVASYTPQQPVFATYTKIYTDTPTATKTNTYTPGPTSTTTPTSTPTATYSGSASPTPTDKPLAAPFVDSADNKDLWHAPFDNAWAALLWDRRAWSSGGNPTSLTPPGGGPNATEDYLGDLRINFASPLPLQKPAVVGSDNYYIAYTNKVASKVVFEGRYYGYSFVVGPNDAVRFTVDGALITSVFGNGTTPGVIKGNYQWVPTDTTFTPARSYHDIKIEYWAGASGPHQLLMVFSTLADQRTSVNTECNWQPGAAYRSPSNGWSDSPGSYIVGTNCNLRLRGSINLSGLTAPRLIFWDRWNVNANVDAWVGIREYTWNGLGADWTWVSVHNNTYNLAWTREFFDLKAFGLSNFLGKTVELAFRVDATVSGALPADGWYIDDISIDQDVVNDIAIEAHDNADDPPTGAGGPNLKWINECSWARATGQNHTPGIGYTYAYQDSPTGLYVPGTNCSLITDGVIDLRPYNATNPKDPELNFFAKWDLKGTGTQFVVERLRKSQRGSWNIPGAWEALKPRGSAIAEVASGTVISDWTPISIDLRPDGTSDDEWFIRFRLKTDALFANKADGIAIDDIDFIEHVTTTKPLPFYEPFDTINDWTLGGTWGLASSYKRSGAFSLADSPAGNYPTTATRSGNTAILTPQIDLNGATKPTLEFWVRWKTSASANLYLDAAIETDAFNSYPTTLWSHMYGTDNVNQAWQHIVIPLYQAPNTRFLTHQILLRFSLEVASGIADDGMFIDDLRIWDDNAPLLLAANPYYNNMEGETETIANSTANWYAGGDWKLDATTARSGTKTWYSSPNGNAYPAPGDSILELAPTLDMNAAPKPILTFWTNHTMQSGDTLRVEVRRDASTTWNNLNWTTTTGVPKPNEAGTTNAAWTRNIVDLSAYATDVIHVRFALKANSSAAGGGWRIDDVYVGPRNTIFTSTSPQAYTTDFTRGGSVTDLPGWTLEADWQAVNMLGRWHSDLPDGMTPFPGGYDPGNGTPTIQWNADYFHGFNATNMYGTNPNTATNICVAGNGIDNMAVVGAATQTNFGVNSTMNWSGGSNPTNTLNSATGQQQALSLTTTTSSFTFTVPAGLRTRTLKLFLTPQKVNYKITATVPTSGGPISATDTLDLTAGGKNLVTHSVGFLTDQLDKVMTVTIAVNSLGSAPNALGIRGIAVSTDGAVGAPGVTFAVPVQAPAAVNNFDISTQIPAAADWLAFPNTAAASWVRKGDCLRPFQYQTKPAIDEVYDTLAQAPSSVPAWQTDVNNNINFYSVFTRKVDVAAGKYRFWGISDDGMKIEVIPGSLGGVPEPILLLNGGNSTFPFISASDASDPYSPHGRRDFFWDVNLSAGTYFLRVTYYQASGDAAVKVRMASDLTKDGGSLVSNDALHNNAGTTPATIYTVGTRTAAYYGANGWTTTPPPDAPSGGFSIPAGKAVTIFFYSRFKVGTAGDKFGVFYTAYAPGQSGPDISDGTVWNAATVQRQQRTNSGPGANYDLATLLGNPVLETVNFNDTAPNNTTTIPSLSYMNWDQHSFVIPAKAFAWTLNLKFELDTRANTTPASAAEGWYIDELGVVPAP